MNGRVLIVDDEPDIVSTLKARFEASDYEVITAANGAEGVEKTLQYHPQMIIMDVIMPIMSGGDAVRRIKALKGMQNIPILFLTALADYLNDQHHERCVKIDGQFFPALAKPFDSKALVLTVAKLMAGSKSVDS
ncbi:MAG: response regulator [Candidatus Omnitrophica bacterium]|jgi:CheY-like chemotaxis protein|nr:response regulator [Candidatus Omnitrophota bacterium]